MPSYQDIEQRLRVIEAKVDFTMRTFAVTQEFPHPLLVGSVIRETKSLLDIYHQVNGLGMTVGEVVAPTPSKVTVESNATDGPSIDLSETANG